MTEAGQIGQTGAGDAGRAPAASTRSGRRINVAAAVIGNTLEWFDILVYATLVPYISAKFFPGDPASSTMMALGAFGSSFVVRPVGGIFAGWFADRAGRRGALALISILMFVGTGMIAFLPGHESIGIAAPALLVLARLIQGFAAGGEFGSATAYLAEQSRSRRGYYASWQFASQGLGILMAALFGAVLTSILPDQAMGDWGWRVPFVFGMLVGPVAYVIRFHADESPEFAQAAEQRHDRADLVLDRGFWGRVMVGAALVVVGSAMLYLLIYMPTLVTAQFGVSRSASLWTSVCAGLTLLCATPVAGAIGDRYGRQWLALPSCALLVPAPILLFHLLDANPTATQALLTQFLLALPVAAYLGALAAMLSDLFSLRHRSLGLAICYNAAVVAAGAFAPLIYAELGARVGRVAPSYYASAAAVISLLALGIVLSRRWLPRD